METTLAAPTARDGEAAKTHAASETPEPEPQPDTGGVTPIPDQDTSDAPADPLTTLSRRTGCTVEWLESLGLRNDRRRCIERLCGRKVIHDAVRIPLADPLTGEEVSHQHWIPCRHPHKPGRHDDLAAAGKQWGELAPVLVVGLNGNREAIMTEGATDTFRLMRLLEAEGAPLSVLGLPGVSNAKNLAKRLAEQDAVEDLILALDNDAPARLCRDEAISEWLKHRTGNQTISFITDLAERADLCSHAEEHGDAGVLDLFDSLLEAVPPADDTRRSKQRRNAKARSSAIDRVHDDGRVIFLAGRIWEHFTGLGWLHLADHIIRARLATELANDLSVTEQDVTPRLTSDTLQAFKDTCQPPAAAEIERMDTNEAANLKDGRPVRGTPWLDVMLRITDNGDVQLLPRDATIWCPRPPIPVEWDDGSYVPPAATLAWLRRATTTEDESPDAAEAHHRADWLMAAVGQVLTERPEDEVIWVLIGAGRRGKGTFLRLVKALVGGSSYECSGPEELADRFAMSHLETSRVLAITDAPPPNLKDRDTKKGVGRIKAMSGGDQVRCEQKHGAARSVRLRCIVMVASNDVPAWASSASDLDAWMGRMRVSEWSGPMPSQRVPNYYKRLIAADGLPNIARYTVEQYRRLLRGDLTEPPEWEEARAQVLKSGIDPLERWASECLTRSASAFTPTADLTDHCRRWAEYHDIDLTDDHGSSRISKETVGAAVRAKFPLLRSQRKRQFRGGPKVSGWMAKTVWKPPEDETGQGGQPPHASHREPLIGRTSGGTGENPCPPCPEDDPERKTAAAQEMIFGSQPPRGAHGGEF